MHSYISILRGINVSGQKKILMADLKVLFEKQGFKNITTYIQSGNVIFEDGKKTHQQLEQAISKAIEKQYGFEVPVIVRTADEMKKVLTTNPFLKTKGINVEKLHVTFLSDIPGAAELKVVQTFDYPPDQFKVIGQEVFLYCPESYGETKLSNKFFENKLQVTATTRNWKTVNTLVELALKNKV
ncbi:MAG: hypothetical protein JWM14_2209 [Chitinophagaceae bacterium]|nr:hypothetical protein [Chitinophagaceae bacterium]